MTPDTGEQQETPVAFVAYQETAFILRQMQNCQNDDKLVRCHDIVARYDDKFIRNNGDVIIYDDKVAIYDDKVV